jgi:hypothetical protein
MANIIINNRVSAKGKLSVDRMLNETKDGFVIAGVFASHLYYEDIKSLESERFKISGIQVYKESFGSDDYDILYHFIAEKFVLKDAMQDGIGYILYGEEMRQIESEMYKNDHPILGGIGEQYKDMYIKEEEDDEDDSEQ